MSEWQEYSARRHRRIRVRRPDDGAETDRELNEFAHVGAALRLAGVEQPLAGRRPFELPGEVGGVPDTGAHALPGKGRGPVRAVPGREQPSATPRRTRDPVAAAKPTARARHKKASRRTGDGAPLHRLDTCRTVLWRHVRREVFANGERPLGTPASRRHSRSRALHPRAGETPAYPSAAQRARNANTPPRRTHDARCAAQRARGDERAGLRTRGNRVPLVVESGIGRRGIGEPEGDAKRVRAQQGQGEGIGGPGCGSRFRSMGRRPARPPARTPRRPRPRGLAP